MRQRNEKRNVTENRPLSHYQEVFEQSRQLLIDAVRTVTEEELSRFIILAEGMEGYDIKDRMKAFLE